MADTQCLRIEQSSPLKGDISLSGAKNAVLVIMASLLLTSGKSRLANVPRSSDVLQMINLLTLLGAKIYFDESNHVLEVDTTDIHTWNVSPEIMSKMRASILVMGPLLVRFGRAHIALPGGCVIGKRPIDFHIKNFVKLGVHFETQFETQYDVLNAVAQNLVPKKIILEYPSVGATENIMMLAVGIKGITRIINASLEPEVMDLIAVLKKMGAHICIQSPAVIEIEGGHVLSPIQHEVIIDRLEAGSLLCATAITGGELYLPQAPAFMLDVVLLKLEEMGHTIEIGSNDTGIRLKATHYPRAVSFKTNPFPGFPTDLQAPMMALQTVASGISVIEELVFENRLLHVRELQKMGAQIKVEHNKATIIGVDELYGTHIIATDIRASSALVIAGLKAKGTSCMAGLGHWRRGYDALEHKLTAMGAQISINDSHAQHIDYDHGSNTMLHQTHL